MCKRSDIIYSLSFDTELALLSLCKKIQQGSLIVT